MYNYVYRSVVWAADFGNISPVISLIAKWLSYSNKERTRQQGRVLYNLII